MGEQPAQHGKFHSRRRRWPLMAVGRHRRLIAALVVLVVAIAVGIAFGYLAGIAVVLVGITIVLLVVGTSEGLDASLALDTKKYYRERMGADGDDSRTDR